MSTATKLRYTPQEYLELERKSPTRNEYYKGEIFAMAGASRQHNLIVGNVNAEIRERILSRPCESYATDMRVCIEATGLYTYPDVVVVCGGPRFQDHEGIDTLLNPTVIFEVLSESTEAYDRGVKFGHYRRIPSLREYVLVSQDRMFVERYIKQGENWVLSDFSLPEHVLRLDSVDCAIPLDRIYAKVTFEPKPDVATQHPH
jgi:Uma2 family endonuclease